MTSQRRGFGLLRDEEDDDVPAASPQPPQPPQPPVVAAAVTTAIVPVKATVRRVPIAEFKQQAEDTLKKYWGHSQFRGPQWQIIEAVLRKRDVFTMLSTGMGKCWSRGTRLRLFTGETIAVEDVQEDDLLIGDDGAPKRVSKGSLTHGRGQLFTITPSATSGTVPFTVNAEHILVLRNSVVPSMYRYQRNAEQGTPVRWGVKEWYIDAANSMRIKTKFFAGEQDALECLEAKRAVWQPLEWEVPLKEYVQHSKNVHHVCKMFTAGPTQFYRLDQPVLQDVLRDVSGREPTLSQIEWMAWYLGLWMADGDTNNAIITQGGPPAGERLSHHEVFDRLLEYEAIFGEKVKMIDCGKSSLSGHVRYRFVFGNPKSTGAMRVQRQDSVAQRVLAYYDVLGHKRIPMAWLCDSLHVRRHIFAGLIDGDGHLGNECYEIPAKEPELLSGVRTLAQTLGLRCGKVQHRTIKLNGKRFPSNRTMISGDMWPITQHCALSYKRSRGSEHNPRINNKDHNVFGFTITPAGVDEYFGFAVDGTNKRLLMADFTVTHNSLLYQVPPLLLGKTAVVVSPLISLMQDQVMSLNSFGISAVALNSNNADDTATRNKAWRGEYRLVYMAPETLINNLSGLAQLYKTNRLCLFACDEAHVVSEFGHDFRPSYRRLQLLREQYPRVPILAVTATATQEVQDDIIQQLRLDRDKMLVVRSTVNRPNLDLFISAKTKEMGDSLTAEIIGHEPCIIFCLTQKDTGKVADFVRLTHGLQVACYHAGLEREEKERVHRGFVMGEIQVVCATTAFSMGIDLGSIRTIINWGLCKSLETYVQQCGRAGRDGVRSRAYMFWSAEDVGTQQWFINKNEKDAQNMPTDDLYDEEDGSILVTSAQLQKEQQDKLANVERERKLLEVVKRFASSSRCRRQALLEYFDETHPDRCDACCDNCMPEALARVHHDVTDMARQVVMAVHETGGRFGAGVVVDMVRGTGARKLQENLRLTSVDQLCAPRFTSYRQLKHLNEAQVKALVQLLLNMRVLSEVRMLIKSNDRSYMALGVGEAGRPFMDGDSAAYRLDPVPAPFLDTRQERRARVATFGEADDGPEALPLDEKEKRLLTTLTEWRNLEAKNRDLPPDTLMTVVALEGIARARPVDQTHLSIVSGVGEYKARMYGAPIFTIILDACAEYGLSNNVSPLSGTTSTVPMAQVVARPPRATMAGLVEEEEEEVAPGFNKPQKQRQRAESGAGADDNNDDTDETVVLYKVRAPKPARAPAAPAVALPPSALLVPGAVKKHQLKSLDFTGADAPRHADPECVHNAVVGNAQLSILWLLTTGQKSVPEIATMREIQSRTVFSYLAECMLNGYHVPWNKLGITSADEAGVAIELQKHKRWPPPAVVQRNLEGVVDAGKVACIHARETWKKANASRKRKSR